MKFTTLDVSTMGFLCYLIQSLGEVDGKPASPHASFQRPLTLPQLLSMDRQLYIIKSSRMWPFIQCQ
jgi:hypothetical protein